MKTIRDALICAAFSLAIASPAFANDRSDICIYIASIEGKTASIFLLPQSDLDEVEREKSSGKQFPSMESLIDKAKELINSPNSVLFLSDLIYHKEAEAPKAKLDWIFKTAVVERVDKRHYSSTNPDYSSVFVFEISFQSVSPEPIFAKAFLLEDGTPIFRTTRSAEEIFD